jgi:hypothetical protein
MRNAENVRSYVPADRILELLLLTLKLKLLLMDPDDFIYVSNIYEIPAVPCQLTHQ